MTSLTALAIAIFIFLVNSITVIYTWTWEGLPDWEGIFEDFRLEALHGHREGDALSAPLAFAGDGASALTYILEALDILGS